MRKKVVSSVTTSAAGTPRRIDAASLVSDDTPQTHPPQASATKVYVRVRPFNPRELQDSEEWPLCTVRVGPQEGHITILDPAKAYTPWRTYGFDRCFDSNAAGADSDQEIVYQHVGRAVLHNVIGGYNGCIFAYGQTGSGKTYTMLGPPATAAAHRSQFEGRLSSVNTSVTTARTNVSTHPSVRDEPLRPPDSCDGSSISDTLDSSIQNNNSNSNFIIGDAEGLIPRLARDIFHTLRLKHKQNGTHSFRVEMEYYEIYNEKVMDLLTGGVNGTDLRVRHQPRLGAYVEGLVRKHVAVERELLQWIRRGSADRHTAYTKMNDRSSRSHAILSLHIVQMTLDEHDNSSRVMSKLNLVDLAGSERTGASGAEGIHFKEATKINLSLTALGRVIDALADISSGKHGIFCPYRDSNLTWLLMDSLGGNSKTSMVATISPHVLYYEEMCHTLRYASRAKQIVNKVVINEDPQVRQIKLLTQEVARLQSLLREQPRFDYTNEDMERLRSRVLELDQEIADRDLAIEELRARVGEKNTAVVQQLKEETSRLHQDLKDFRRAKSTVLRLQSEAKEAAAVMENLRAQVAALETEKSEYVASRSVLVSPGPLAKSEETPRGGPSYLHLGHKTLQELKRLGISADQGGYAQLIEVVTSRAAAATRDYEAMCQKNTMMVESHSRSLRELLKQKEDKEWSALAAIGEKLVAAHTRALAQHGKTAETQTASEMQERVMMRYKEEMKRKNKELMRLTVLVEKSGDDIRGEKERADKLEAGKEQLQNRLDSTSTELLSLKEKLGRQKEEARILYAQEEGLKRKVEEAKVQLAAAAKEHMVLLQQSREGVLDSTAALMTEVLAERCRILEEEAEARYNFGNRHGKSLLQQHMHTTQEGMNTVRRSLALQQEQQRHDAVKLVSLWRCQTDVLLEFFREKLQLLDASYALHAEGLHCSCKALSDDLACVKHEAASQLRDAERLLANEVARCEAELRQEKEAHSLTLRQLELQMEQYQRRLEVDGAHHKPETYLAVFEQQLHDALHSSAKKEMFITEHIQQENRRRANKLEEEIKATAQMTAQLQDELATTQHQHRCDLDEFQNKLKELKRRSTEEQRILQETHNDEIKRLHTMITAAVGEKEAAIKKAFDTNQLLSATETLMAANNAMHIEQISAMSDTVVQAVGQLRTDYAALSAGMSKRAAEAQRAHEEELCREREEHAKAVGTLERKVAVAKTVLAQQREEAKREADALRAAHSVALDDASCLLVNSHAAFAEHCAAEHAAWGAAMCDTLRTVGVAADCLVGEWQQHQLEVFVQRERRERETLTLWQEAVLEVLRASLESSCTLASGDVIVSQVLSHAEEAVLFDRNVLLNCASVDNALLPSTAISVLVISLLEQYKQCGFEEFTAYMSDVYDLQRNYAIEVTTSALWGEYDVALATYEDIHRQKLMVLQKENTELKLNLSKVREDLEFQANLDQLEEEIAQGRAKQYNAQHYDIHRSSKSMESGDFPSSSPRRNSSGLGAYFSSLFQLGGPSVGGPDAGFPPEVKSPRTAAALSPARPPLAPSSASKANQVVPPHKKPIGIHGVSPLKNDLHQSVFYD
ncbi:kinesin [Trypanosoma grayi]|uniref:kinesin n=1 Tax=Trypanosoma grayi TaxID=71804 RepID=UPI0004F45B6B|nr:kinesin [Trypanosoma grayi]KEG08841.1 kinesin [Trypanosoma grayi]